MVRYLRWRKREARDWARRCRRGVYDNEPAAFQGCEREMLHLPRNGHKVYEVAIYNSNVRQLVMHNRSHSYVDDHWAKPQTRNVVARDEAEARKLIAERFPPEEGFVIQRMNQSRY